MLSQQQTYLELLDETEFAFLIRKERQERRLYIIIYIILLLMSFTFPFLTSWFRVSEGANFSFSFSKFFLSLGVLLFISTFSIYTVYKMFLHKIQLDIKNKTKTVEGHKIMRKVVVPSKNTFHFYIDSAIKLSIEVSAADFNNYTEGDEVYIEYATNSKEYFGYF